MALIDCMVLLPPTAQVDIFASLLLFFCLYPQGTAEYGCCRDYSLLIIVMIMAYATGAFQLAFEIGRDHILGFALGSYNDFNVVLVEDLNGSTTHTTADDDIYVHIIEEVRQEARLVAGVSYRSFTEDLSLLGFEDLKGLTMAKVARYTLVIACYCNFQHRLLQIL